MSRQELTEFQKGQIDGANKFGHTVPEIQKVLGFPRSTIRGVIARLKIRGFSENIERVGRPRKSTDRDERLLIRKALDDTKMPLRELKFESNSNLSISSIRRRLGEEHIKKWIAAERSRLTEAHASKRFDWSKEHLDWTVDDWRKYIWSDECSVEKGADPRQMWVFRRPGDAEKFKPKNVKPKDKCKGVSVMVWGCFASNIRGPLAVCHGHMKAVQYINILEDNLLPFIETLPNNIKNDVSFQQDNATIHRARVTQGWFDDNEITVIEWPPNSPDMNPIEHVWKALKAKLHARFPDTYALRGGPERVQEELAKRLQVVWAELEEEVFERLISSMPARVQALYDAKGWYTRY
jgi:transposase